MLQTGNWIVPTYGGVPRLEKPPLGYWAIATSGWMFGGVTEWSARLPAALSALALAGLIAVWAYRWYGREAAFAAAIVQATSAYVLYYGRKTEVDMLLCLLTTSALFLIAEDRSEDSRRFFSLRWLGIYVLLGLSWLAKFHYGAAMVVGPAVLYYLYQRRYRALWRFVNPLGLVFLGACVVVWPALVLKQLPEAADIWLRETWGRAVGQLDHRPFWYYIPQILVLILPWTPAAVAAIPASWKQAWKDKDRREQFLWFWILTHNFILILSTGKAQNYLLAMLPAFSLLASRSIVLVVQRAGQRRDFLQKRSAATLCALCLVGFTVAGFVFGRQWPQLKTALLAVSLMAGVGTCTIIGLLARRRLKLAGIATVLTFLAGYLGIAGWIIPGRDHRMPTAHFGQEVREKFVPSGQTCCVFRLGRAPIVFYLGAPTLRMESPEALADRLATTGELYVVSDESSLAELSELGDVQTLASLDATKRRGRSSLLLTRLANKRLAAKPARPQ